SRIQIATRVFYFVLPDTAPPRSPSPDSQCSPHSHSRSRSQSRTRSLDGSISIVRNTPPRRRSPSVDIMSVASAESGDETQWVDVEPPPQPVPAKGTRKPVADKDKGAHVDVAPIRAKGGKGKGKGKAPAASRDHKRKQPDPEPSTSKSVPVASKAPSKSVTVIKGAPSYLPTPESGTEPPPQRPAITEKKGKRAKDSTGHLTLPVRLVFSNGNGKYGQRLINPLRPNLNPSLPLPPLADDGTDGSIDVEAEEEEIRGTGPPRRIDTSTVIDEAKRRRAEKEERRRLKAEKRERRERREKERAMKAAKRLAAAGGPSAVPSGQPPPFFFPPYGQPYPFPPFMIPMPMPPPYMVPGPDGQMIPMPMPPYMMGAPNMGGKDGKPENGQLPPQPFMVKGPDGQMIPAPAPPYGFPPYGYPYYLPQGPYWMPYAAPDEKKDAGGSPTVVKREEIDEEKTVSPQPHAPPWIMPHGIMPYPLPIMWACLSALLRLFLLQGRAGRSPFRFASLCVKCGRSRTCYISTSRPSLAPTMSPAPTMALPSPALGLSPSPVPVSGPTPGTSLNQVPMTGLSPVPVAPAVVVSPPPPLSPASVPVSAPTPMVSTTAPSARVSMPMPVPTPPAPTTPVTLTPTALTASAPAPAPMSAPTPTPTPQTPAHASTSSADLSKVSIPIVVAPLPDSYVPPPGSTPTPYMVLHEQKLWLSPEVFGKLTEERLAELRKLGMREVISTLQADIVQYLKLKMRSGPGAGLGTNARGRGEEEAGDAEFERISTYRTRSMVSGDTGSPNQQTNKPIGPPPNVDGALPTDRSGLNITSAEISHAPAISTGTVRAREGDDEIAPEPKKLKSDVIGTA
ncbi:hypothetical protein RHS01_00496, partial [Rhizoctonia solani]